ncbi:MAG: twin-arginine translocase TatA/TatE family subunit [Bacteroidaceae bacterium]|nr:twin-arginine translocase TatA/TatE family subunit [Bacteroidaceae bacterium]
MKLYPLLLGLGTSEIIFIVFVILLLFGAARIPDLMKSMGKGVKSFKEGMKEVEKEISAPDEPAAKGSSGEAETESK